MDVLEHDFIQVFHNKGTNVPQIHVLLNVHVAETLQTALSVPLHRSPTRSGVC